MQKLSHCFVITLLGIQENQVFKSESPISLIPNHPEHQFKSDHIQSTLPSMG